MTNLMNDEKAARKENQNSKTQVHSLAVCLIKFLSTLRVPPVKALPLSASSARFPDCVRPEFRVLKFLSALRVQPVEALPLSASSARFPDCVRPEFRVLKFLSALAVVMSKLRFCRTFAFAFRVPLRFTQPKFRSRRWLGGGRLFIKKPAFTLAETLITLVIVGIVAAVTVPIILNKNGNMELKTRYKKSYSTMLKAFEKMNFDNGQVYECYYLNEGYGVIRNSCTAMFNNFAKQMNVIKYCQTQPLMNGCIPNYDLSTDNWQQYAVFAMSISPAWVLGDGSIMIGYGKNAYWPIFLIDINGMKGPNRPGYDVFSYYIWENDKKKVIIKPSNYISSKSNGTYRNSDWMLQEMLK